MRMTETGRLTSVVLATLLVGGVITLLPSGANAAAGDISLFAGPSTVTTAPDSFSHCAWRGTPGWGTPSIGSLCAASTPVLLPPLIQR